MSDSGATLSFSPTSFAPNQTSTATSLSVSVEPTVTACSQSLLEWDYNGSIGDAMIIGIYGVRSDDSSSVIEKTIGTFDNNIVGQNSAVWTVDIAEGVYRAYASIPNLGLVANSSDILVFNGTDTSCLDSPLMVSFSTLPNTISTDPSNIPTFSISTSSATTESAPGFEGTQGASDSHPMSNGSILGSAAGAFVFAGFLYLYLRMQCRSSSATETERPESE